MPGFGCVGAVGRRRPLFNRKLTTENRQLHCPSPAGAEWESPARKCRVASQSRSSPAGTTPTPSAPYQAWPVAHLFLFFQRSPQLRATRLSSVFLICHPERSEGPACCQHHEEQVIYLGKSEPGLPSIATERDEVRLPRFLKPPPSSVRGNRRHADHVRLLERLFKIVSLHERAHTLPVEL
jgi:hypothetical protein